MKKDRELAFRHPDEAELTLRASDCVGAQHELFGDRQAKRLGGLEFDDEPERRRLLDRDIGGFGSAQDLVEQLGGALERAGTFST
jgi:hypothetical protein